jgi:hypothetical protein
MMISRETVEFEVTRKDKERDLLFVEYKVYYLKNEFSQEQLDIVIDKDDIKEFIFWVDILPDKAQTKIYSKIEEIVETKQKYGYLPETDHVVYY